MVDLCLCVQALLTFLTNFNNFSVIAHWCSSDVKTGLNKEHFSQVFMFFVFFFFFISNSSS